MLIILAILTSLASIAIFVSGLLALLRNTNSKQNLWFFILAAFIAIWIPFNFIDSNIIRLPLTIIALKFDFSIAIFIPWAAAQFVKLFSETPLSYANKKVRLNPYFLYISVLVNFFFWYLIVSNRLYSTSIKGGTLSVNYGNPYLFYVATILIYFIYTFAKLFASRHKASVFEKNLFNLIITGFFVATLSNLLTNLLFPYVIHDRTIVKELNIIGYVGFLILVIFIYLAITTQKLFDIRSFVVRSLAYLLAFSLAAFILITPAVLLTTFISNNPFKLTAVLSLAALTLVVAVIFQPVRKLFNKVTNKLFFRDYYEPQLVLDRLSKLLVGSIELEHITSGSTRILSEAVKPQFLDFLLLTDTTESDKDFLKLLSDSHAQIIVSDEINRENKISLYNALHEKDIAEVIRLRTSKTDLGFILIGYKRSGAIFSEVDKNLLGIAADEIAISLQNALHFREIQRFNITLQEKIEAATQQLRLANDRLKSLDEAKDDFISMASHQLRTPLSLIKGYIKMVVIGDAGKVNTKQSNFLTQAEDNAERMVNLVTELLSVSRITSGKFIIEPSTVDLADLVDKEVKVLTSMAETHQVTLTFNKPDNFPLLLLDEEKMKQVVINFIDNAIHYSRPKGGKIDVQLTYGNSIEFRVVDNGIGVPEHEKQNLFTKFYRAKNAIDVRPDGTGIGLYLAKEVVTKQGGELIFDSKRGVGSTFGFRFNKDKIVKGAG